MPGKSQGLSKAPPSQVDPFYIISSSIFITLCLIIVHYWSKFVTQKQIMDLQGQGSSELFQAQSHLYKHVFSYISSMSLKCAIQLGIPDIINNHAQPITLPELVSALKIRPEKIVFVHRLMRLLVHSGLFVATKTRRNQEQEQELWLLTPFLCTGREKEILRTERCI